MKKKKFWSILVCVSLLLLAGMRIYHVNQELPLASTAYFQVGEVVSFEDDFHDNSSDAMQGYSIQVLDSKLLDKEAFLAEYHVSGEEIAGELSEYYYIVKVSCRNMENTNGAEEGIALEYLSLVGTSFYAMLDSELFALLNPDMPGTSFSLKLDTEKEMLLVYGLNTEAHGSYQKILNRNPGLQLTEYPRRKVVELR